MCHPNAVHQIEARPLPTEGGISRDDDFTCNGLVFVDGRPTVILKEVQKLEFDNAHRVRFERTAN